MKSIVATVIVIACCVTVSMSLALSMKSPRASCPPKPPTVPELDVTKVSKTDLTCPAVTYSNLTLPYQGLDLSKKSKTLKSPEIKEPTSSIEALNDVLRLGFNPFLT